MKLGFLVAAAAWTAILVPGVAVAGDPVQPLTNIPPIDGSNHNLSDPSANQAGTRQKRFLPDAYLDHLGGDSWQFPGQDRPGARDISNHVFTQDPAPVLNPLGHNNFLWQFGQFLDHDFGITVEKVPAEHIDIPVPPDDPFFDPILRPFITIERARMIPAPALRRARIHASRSTCSQVGSMRRRSMAMARSCLARAPRDRPRACCGNSPAVAFSSSQEPTCCRVFRRFCRPRSSRPHCSSAAISSLAATKHPAWR